MSDTLSIDGLKEVFPATITLTINGQEVEVKPYTFRHLLKAFGYLGKITEAFAYIPLNNEINLFTAIALGLGNNDDAVLSLVKLATDKDEAFLEGLSASNGLDLLTAVWQVNKDFFYQKLQPALKELSPNLPSQSENEPSST